MQVLIKEIVQNCNINLYTENIYLLEKIPISIKIQIKRYFDLEVQKEHIYMYFESLFYVYVSPAVFYYYIKSMINLFLLTLRFSYFFMAQREDFTLYNI